jgi:hypothetical protein
LYTSIQSTIENLNIFNNTFYGSVKNETVSIIGGARPGLPGQCGIAIPYTLTFKNSSFKNNLTYAAPDGKPAAKLQGVDGISFSNNYWSQEPPAVGKSITDVIAPNPMMINPLIPQTPGSIQPELYKLTASSPVINKATPVSYITKDFFGATRPVGSAPDIGAHEYGGVPAPTTPIPTSKTTPTNPASPNRKYSYQ